MNNYPKIIPVFPLSNFIIFPRTTVPLNIFEPRYIDMINDSMKSNKMIGMIQPKNLINENNIPKLHEVGCLGKITSFRETDDGRFLIELKGLIRFKKIKEKVTEKKYPNNIIDVELSDLTKNKEEKTKNILDFCEIKMKEDFLDFDKNKNLFNKTNSFLQVRNKIKQYEVNKYHPYYYLIDNFKL